jgi:hypothetical protein
MEEFIEHGHAPAWMRSPKSHHSVRSAGPPTGRLKRLPLCGQSSGHLGQRAFDRSGSGGLRHQRVELTDLTVALCPRLPGMATTGHEPIMQPFPGGFAAFQPLQQQRDVLERTPQGARTANEANGRGRPASEKRRSRLSGLRAALSRPMRVA